MQVSKFSIKRQLANLRASQALRNAGATVLCGALMSSHAFAQFQSVTTTVSTITTVLQGVAVGVFTICLMWAGFQIAFQHKKVADVAHIVIGGAIVGGAAGIASILVS
jgi:type IV secretion system protein VirB2